MGLMQNVVLNLKNLPGWRTNRKIVVFSVDDYGNVRLDSKESRQKMDEAGIIPQNRFDRLDTLETRQDLEMLYETLQSVQDKNNRYAVFTPFALPCNINFEKVEEGWFGEYHYELLPETFQKLSARQPKAYEGAWEILKQGIKEGLMVPQFHGREHLNLKVLEEKLQEGNPELIIPLKNRSFTGISDSGYSTISAMAAFDFWKFDENERLKEIARDGLLRFEEVYGYRPTHFTPPVYNVHPALFGELEDGGIRYVDTAMIKKEHQGEGLYSKRFNYTGKKISGKQCFIVRNVVFEPTQERSVNWVKFALRQIEAAFRWNKPAIISSHRVNFCGHIDPKNREAGLLALKELLSEIVYRWPDVEFMAANELGDLVSGLNE